MTMRADEILGNSRILLDFTDLSEQDFMVKYPSLTSEEYELTRLAFKEKTGYFPEETRALVKQITEQIKGCCGD